MKVALITASTSGIGLAIGKEFLKEGVFVIFNYANNKGRALKLEKELELLYPKKFEIIQTDLSNYDKVSEFSMRISKKYKKIDYLVLNAGTTCREKIKEITKEQWEYVMNVNVNMPFFLTQNLFDSINPNGRIIFISSILGIYPHSTSIPYSVSKAAQEMLSRTLVKEFKEKGVTVNTIAPGFIETLWQKSKPKELKEKIENKIALKRFGKPEEIAELCMEICRNQYINGSTLKIDGGYCTE